MAAQVLIDQQLWQQLLALVLASAIVMGSPGPATISVTAVGAAFGLRDSLRYASGIVFGTILVLLVVATGIMAVLAALPKLAALLAVASAAYILYLAFKIATAPPQAGGGGGAARTPGRCGLRIGVGHPQPDLAIAAVFAGASSGAGDLAVSAKLAVLALMIVAIHLLWLLAGAAFARMLRKPLASRIVNLVFAVTLVATAALAALP
ncbi:LysE family transporter [Mesorhizobium sp. M0571]|uniref:LysE family transporter n=1 Tax=Mesorhizobium sp. M0571 TaxID=2956960 RepID=UPI00333DD4EF